MRVRLGPVWLVFSSLRRQSACGPAVDLTKGLQILDVSTGWFDAGIVNGQNKLVPAISFKLKNVSDQKLTVLQVNVLFKRDQRSGRVGQRLRHRRRLERPGSRRDDRDR